MVKRLPFTIKNVINSFSEVTGLAMDKLSVDEEMGPSTKFCSIHIEPPVLGDRKFDDVTIYRNQNAIDECSADDLSFDDDHGFYDVGNLSDGDIVRCASKGCRLSDLRYWIISEGRDQRLSDAQIEARLKRPLETLIEHYREVDMEGAFITLVRQCRSAESKMARYLIEAAGGAQKVWKDELFEELPGGFVMHLILDEDISLFRQLKDNIEKARQKN